MCWVLSLVLGPGLLGAGRGPSRREGTTHKNAKPHGIFSPWLNPTSAEDGSLGLQQAETVGCRGTAVAGDRGTSSRQRGHASRVFLLLVTGDRGSLRTVILGPQHQWPLRVCVVTRTATSSGPHGGLNQEHWAGRLPSLRTCSDPEASALWRQSCVLQGGQTVETQ